MKVDRLVTVEGPQADELWEMYEDSFDLLRTRAAQRHNSTRGEFDTVLRDPRVVKHVVLDDTNGERMCGMAAVANDLDAVPLVSSDYFAARWPEWHADRRIWYVAFLAIHPDYQGTHCISHLVGSITEMAALTGGIVAADICEFNEQELRLPTTIGRLARTFRPGIRTTRLDAQTYWAYEVPPPAGAAASA